MFFPVTSNYSLVLQTPGDHKINHPEKGKRQTVICPKDYVVSGVDAQTLVMSRWELPYIDAKDRTYTLKCRKIKCTDCTW